MDGLKNAWGGGGVVQGGRVIGTQRKGVMTKSKGCGKWPP